MKQSKNVNLVKQDSKYELVTEKISSHNPPLTLQEDKSNQEAAAKQVTVLSLITLTWRNHAANLRAVP